MGYKPDKRSGIMKVPSGRAGVSKLSGGSNLQRAGNRVMGPAKGGVKTTYKGTGFHNPIGRG